MRKLSVTSVSFATINRFQKLLWVAPRRENFFDKELGSNYFDRKLAHLHDIHIN